MSTYGRNFEFRVQPVHGQRAARFIVPTTHADIPFGAPVIVDTAAGTDANGRLPVKLASGSQAHRPGQAGLAMYEWSYNAFQGLDPNLTTYSDRDFAPSGKPVYLASGDYVKIVLRNTVSSSFFGQRTYPGRLMVAGIGATVSLAVGDLLKPQTTPNDTNGYWVETTTATDAWLVVESVNTVRQEVEARFLF